MGKKDEKMELRKWQYERDLLSPLPKIESTPPTFDRVYENVKPVWNRDYVAGLCIARYGLKNGVTEQMEKMFQELWYGEIEYENERDEDGYLVLVWRGFKYLHRAWDICRAYNGLISSYPTQKPQR